MDCVALGLEHSADDFPDSLIVFDDQDGLAALGQRLRVIDRNTRFADVFPGSRQIELDRGALTDLAVNRDVPARLLDEAIDHGQAQPAAAAVGLGGKEGIERPCDDFGRHAGDGVADRHQHILAGLHVGVGGGIGPVEMGIRRLDGEPAAVGHGVTGVDGEVQQRIFQLCLVDHGVPLPTAEHGFDLDVLAQGALQQFGNIGHRPVDVGWPGTERLAA